MANDILITASLCLFVLFFQDYCLEKVNKIHQEKAENNTVYDTFHNIINPNNHYDESVKAIKESIIPITMAIFLYGVYSTENYYLLVKAAYLISVVFLIRALTFSATILPKPNDRCHYDKLTFENVLNLNAFLGQCHDLIFSGHTSFHLILIMMILDNNLFPNINLKPWLYSWHALMLVLILYLKEHYTVDIIVAHIAGIFIYQNF